MECPTSQAGRPDMYGLGIRVAFYIQWFGIIVVEYLNEAALTDIRVLGFLLATATFVALVIQTAFDSLKAAEVYLLMLLAISPYIFAVPFWLWKGFTCCHPYWDPYRYTKERPSPIFKGMNFVLLLAIASYGVWFWCDFIGRQTWDCNEFGFFFSPVDLSNKVFMAFNALFYLIVLLVCLGILIATAGWEGPLWTKQRKDKRISKLHKMALQEIKAFSNLAVAASLMTACEFVVQWNAFEDVNSVSTVGQLIPLFISAGVFCRVIFLHFANGGDDDSDSESSVVEVWSRRSSRRGSHRSSHRSSRRSSRPRPPPPPAPGVAVPGRRGPYPPPPPPG